MLSVGARRRARFGFLIKYTDEIFDGAGELGIDEPVVELGSRLELVERLAKSQVQALGSFGPSGRQTIAQRVQRRRLDENQDGLGHGFANRSGPLHVDLEKNGLSGAETFIHRGAQSSVPLSVHGGRFEEGPAPLELGEL